MNAEDFLALLPELVIAATAVVVMLAIAWRRNHAAAAILTLVGLGAAFGSIFISVASAPRRIPPLLVVDRYSLFYTGLVVAAAFISAAFSHGYFKKRGGRNEELYVLLAAATLGSSILVSSTHFVSFFLGLEILSVALYAMISFPDMQRNSLEAAVKYLVLASVSSAFLLFGAALVYFDLGTLQFSRITETLSPGFNPVFLVAGTILVITGIGFKLGVVPFHLWTPDVYQGSPAPVTAYIATVSKGSVFALLLRYAHESGTRGLDWLNLVVVIVAAASMFAGNLLALLQNNVKRILAYSSIAHLGYLLVAFLSAGILGLSAAAFYLAAYVVSMLGALGVVTVLSGGKRDADSLEDYRGLFWKRPLLSGFFIAMLLSLAGIPLTAGFLGKFYIVAAGISSALRTLVFILVVSSTIGLFYYLRITATLFGKEHGTAVTVEGAFIPSVSGMDRVMMVLIAVLLFWFGIYPAPFLSVIHPSMTP